MQTCKRKRIIDTSDDAGGLAIAMKLNSSIEKLKGVSSNIKNSISFLDVQDGIMRQQEFWSECQN